MKTVILSVMCVLVMSCSFTRNGKKNSDNEVEESAVASALKTGFRDSVLTYPGSSISFNVGTEGDTLVIRPSGLSVSNEALYHDITGYTVVNAETGDLNIDGYPEVFVYLVSDGSGSYGRLIGYSVNNGKSVSQVYLPDVSENTEAGKGYMGHDEMAIVENTFCLRFPVYKEGDSNSEPTGGARQIQYRLVDGEAGRILEVDKILEF